MQAAITQLEIYLDTLINNAPINEREGNLEQAELERKNAAEVKQALTWLEIGRKWREFVGADLAKH